MSRTTRGRSYALALPLCFGQYYKPSWQSEIINEYCNPIGDHFMDTTRNYFRQTMGYCPGFINDMSHAGSLYRHNDVVAQRTPGRSFARDLGSFIRKALGRRQRYEVLQGFRDNGSRATFWSDGGAFSYTLCAFSSGIAIEGAGVYKDLVGAGQYVVPARNLLGEKPLTAMTHLNDDWIGYYLKPEEFPTMKDLRDYYRYCERQLVLWCLDRGVTLDPTSYFWGRQFSWESAPVLVESGTRGRQRVPTAEVAEPLWVRRSGRDLNSMLVIGNHEPRAVETDVLVHNRYSRAAPLFVPFFGGELRQRVDGERTTITGVNVAPRDYAALHAAALVDGEGPRQAVAHLAGDGLEVRLTLQLDSAKPARLWVQTFAPAYRIASARIDGRAVTIDDEPLRLEAGERRIEVAYQTEALPFDAATWKQVELLRNGQPNFRVQSDPGVTDQPDPAMPQNTFEIGFERGTARMLAEFVEAYDDENGRVGDMRSVAISDQPRPDYSGWTVVLRRDPLVACGRVQIEAAGRRIIVEGPTQGQMRRAMVMLMRLVDRTYPHIGMFQPLRYRKQAYDHTKPVPMDRWIVRIRTREFFQKFGDQRFWVKPILDARYEPLYADDNTDFAGKYELRWTPWIVEPTYGDSFVYGYSGPGTADTTEELRRRTRPEQPKSEAAKADTE